MASKVERVEVTDNAVIVFVDHLNSDSFSRSVNRATNKAWHDATAGDWELKSYTQYVSRRYAHTDLGNGHCMSTAVYTRSWTQANKILDQLHVPA